MAAADGGGGSSMTLVGRAIGLIVLCFLVGLLLSRLGITARGILTDTSATILSVFGLLADWLQWVIPYILAQLAGAILAALVLYLIASGKTGFDLAGGFASNGYGEHSPGGYTLVAGFVTELILTAGFLFVIMGATDTRAPSGFAPLAIGLALTLIHLISIPVTNTSVNPARSTGPALLVGGWALAQLWLFWLAPILGGIMGGVAYRWLATAQPVAAADVPAAAD